MATYRLLADLTLYVHGAYVLFVVLGLPVILIGAWRGWGWVRNFWFRLVHLSCMVFVGLEALAGVTCPLTVLERHYRTLAGDSISSQEFFAYWVGRILFIDLPQSSFDMLHVGYSLLLICLFVFIPPRWPWGAAHPASAAPGVGAVDS